MGGRWPRRRNPCSAWWAARPCPVAGPKPRRPASIPTQSPVRTITYQVPSGVRTHRLSVADTTGREVLARTVEGGSEQNAVDISTLKADLYDIRLADPNFASEFRFNK